MALRGVKPSKIQKRLKVFFYGNAKVGKTTASIQFPKPYLIDTEGGAENDKYVDLLEASEALVFQNNDFNDILEEVKSLLSTKHEYKTLIIDPLTIVYDDLVEKCSSKGTEFGRHYAEANKMIKHLFRLLTRLDMNVIITSHAKNVYAKDLSIIGTTYDCYKKIDYLFDLIIEVQKRGNERVGIVKGSRIKGFEGGEQFPFSYENIAEKYGREVLERVSVPVVLASSQQIDEIKRLIELLKIPVEIYQKWLDKGEAENFDEMTSENIDSCISLLNKKLTKGE